MLNRVKLLQEENDELYAILKGGQVAKLKEEVNGLTRVVQGLETALHGTDRHLYRTLSSDS